MSNMLLTKDNFRKHQKEMAKRMIDPATNYDIADKKLTVAHVTNEDVANGLIILDDRGDSEVNWFTMKWPAGGIMVIDFKSNSNMHFENIEQLKEHFNEDNVEKCGFIKRTDFGLALIVRNKDVKMLN